MILKLLNLKIKELRGCPHALTLIDEFVGNCLDNRMDEFHKVIHFFEKCIQLLIRKGHTYRSGVLSDLHEESIQKKKNQYMKSITFSIFRKIDLTMDAFDDVNMLDENDHRFNNDVILSYTYLHYLVLFNGNPCKFGKKINTHKICCTYHAPYSLDNYHVICNTCKRGYHCSEYAKFISFGGQEPNR